MLDLKFVRENLPLLQEKIAGRGMSFDLAPLRELESRRRRILGDLESLRQQRNAATKEIAAKKKARESADAEIAAIFSEEAAELLEEADQALGAWKSDRKSRDNIEALKRHLHTLKGGARKAGIAAMGDLSHEIEALITERAAARKAKDFAKSDRIRDELAAKGVIIEDGAEGATWRRE